MQMWKPFFCVLAVVSLGGVGCDSKPALDVVPASGTVFYDNQPIEGVTLTLVPQEGVKGRGGYAVSAADGTFKFQASPEAEGVVPGKYLVLFQKYTMPDGSPIPPGTSAADANFSNELSEVYSQPDQSPIYTTISDAGENDLKFELTARPQRRL